jgi:hypothetical protein
MVSRYFDKFPQINYNGFNIVNIMESAKLTNKYLNVPYIYEQKALSDNERADNTAAKYYDDSYLTWLIYYANKIIDPYYGWHMNEGDFNDYITQKYVSIDVAQRKVEQFITNWFDDTRRLTPSAFLNEFGQFSGIHANYWEAIYDENTGRIIFYVRKRKNLQLNTNKLVKVLVDNASKFSSDDLVSIYQFSNGVQIGTAEIEKAGTNNYIILRSVLGNIANNYYLKKDDGSTCHILKYALSEDFTNDVWTHTNISNEEYIYWTPITSYDLENEYNNFKKIIKLIDAKLVPVISTALEEELNA